MNFIKTIIAVVFGIALFLFACFGALALFGSMAGKETVVIDENTVLKLNLNQEIKETAEENPFEGLPLPEEFAQMQSTGLNDIKEALEKAAKDADIKGVVLETSNPNCGYATAQEIREAILAFKKSGKFVFVYGEYFSEKGYFIASVADRIFLNVGGMIELNGLSSEVIFFKNTLEKMGIKPLVFRVGTYKSAVEPFLTDQMSEENRQQITEYLNGIYDFYLKQVAETRQIPFEELKNISAKMLVKTPEDALKYKLVTDTVYQDGFEEALKKQIGIETKAKIKYVSVSKYQKVNLETDETIPSDKIAIIVAEGEITSGKSTESTVGSETIAEELKKARLNDKIKAVVFRINSPGGSLIASDVMWREVQLLKKAKPVIASMSDLAASGGYYLAMGCDTIVAQPNTITGSIGIFGLLFNAQNLMTDKLGLTFDRVSTGEFSDLGNPTRDMNEAEQAMIQTMIEKGYKQFTSKAAEGRKMPLDSLLKVASGRVWTGEQAKQNGLVDVLGNLQTAIDIAAKKAKLEKYQIKYYPQEKDFFQKFAEMQSRLEAKSLQEKLGIWYPTYLKFEQIKHWQGVQARLPYEVEVE